MPQISIVDDNAEQSGTVKTYMMLELERLGSDLNVLTIFPYRNLNEYSEFINSNNVVALVIDEKLNDQSFDDNGPVGYKGTDLVTVLRQQHKELPIFTITAIATDADLLEKRAEYDYIIQRSDFYEHSEKYVPIILRSVQRYLEQNRHELSEYDSLTRQVASGEYQTEDYNRLSALQVKLQLPFSGFDDRKKWLDTYEEQLSYLNVLKEKLEKRINKI